jgi:hypothetical protein
LDFAPFDASVDGFFKSTPAFFALKTINNFFPLIQRSFREKEGGDGILDVDDNSRGFANDGLCGRSHSGSAKPDA